MAVEDGKAIGLRRRADKGLRAKRVQRAAEVQDNRGAIKRTKSVEREVGVTEMIASSVGVERAAEVDGLRHQTDVRSGRTPRSSRDRQQREGHGPGDRHNNATNATVDAK